MTATKLQLIFRNDGISDITIKELFKTILGLIFSDDYTDELFVEKINEFKQQNAIPTFIPLNIQIQLSLCILSLYSCFFCRHGSEINHRLMGMMNHDINSGSSGELLVNFIITLKKFLPESRCRNLKKYLIILYYIQIIEIYNSNRGRNIDFNYQSAYHTKKFVQNLKNEICVESILKTAQFLIFLAENYNTHDINWMITSIDESLTMGIITKYDLSLRMTPILFSVLGVYSQSQDYHFPFISIISMISCAIICSKNKFLSDAKCMASKFKLTFLSYHDNVFFGKMQMYFNSNFDKKYKTLYENIIKLNSKRLSNESLIDLFFEESDKLSELYIQIHQESQSIFKPVLKPNPIVFHDDHHIMCYENLFSGPFVYVKSKRESGELCSFPSFLCKLNEDIDIYARRECNILAEGPIFFKESDRMKKHMTQWVEDSYFKLNYYVDYLKYLYRFKHIDSFDFVKIVKIRMTKKHFQKHGDDHDENYSDFDRHLDLSNVLSASSKEYDYTDFISSNVESREFDFYIRSDPFGDYRLKSWNFDMINVKNRSIPYWEIKINDISNEIKYLFKIFISFMHGEPLFDKLFKKLYLYFLFKAIFGIRHNAFSGIFALVDFNIEFDKKNNNVKVFPYPNKKFSHPRFPPYDYPKRESYNLSFKTMEELKHIPKMRFTLTPREKRLTFFWKNFNDHTLPVIKEIFQFLNDRKTKYEDFSPSITKNIESLYILNANNSVNYRFSIYESTVKAKHQLTILGTFTYVISKMLGLDTNIFGIDIDFLRKYIDVESEQRKSKNIDFLDIYEIWSWSIVNKTTMLHEFEENEFSKDYYNFDLMVKFPCQLSIRFFKGWLFQSPDNINRVLKTLTAWKRSFIKEKKRISTIDPEEQLEQPENKYIPNVTWLSQMFWPHLMIGINNLIKMYENVKNGDYWDFCEFHYGYNFLQIFLSYMNELIVSFFKYYRKRKWSMSKLG